MSFYQHQDILVGSDVSDYYGEICIIYTESIPVTSVIGTRCCGGRSALDV
jgi:hypothetical protein